MHTRTDTHKCCVCCVCVQPLYRPSASHPASIPFCMKKGAEREIEGGTPPHRERGLGEKTKRIIGKTKRTLCAPKWRRWKSKETWRVRETHERPSFSLTPTHNIYVGAKVSPWSGEKLSSGVNMKEDEGWVVRGGSYIYSTALNVCILGEENSSLAPRFGSPGNLSTSIFPKWKFPLFIRGEETNIKKGNLWKQKIERWTIKIKKRTRTSTRHHARTLYIIEGGVITQLIRVIIDLKNSPVVGTSHNVEHENEKRRPVDKSRLVRQKEKNDSISFFTRNKRGAKSRLVSFVGENVRRRPYDATTNPLMKLGDIFFDLRAEKLAARIVGAKGDTVTNERDDDIDRAPVYVFQYREYTPSITIKSIIEGELKKREKKKNLVD